MKEPKAADLPIELILIIHKKLLETTNPSSAWRSLQINRNWRFASDLTVDFVHCRAFVLDSDNDLNVLNGFLGSVGQRNLDIRELTITNKKVDLLYGVAFNNHKIHLLRFLFHVRGCSIIMPPLKIKGDGLMSFENVLHPSVDSVPHPEPPRRWHDRLRPPLYIDIRCIIEPPLLSYECGYSYMFRDVVSIVRHDQFRNTYLVSLIGNEITVDAFFQKTLPKIEFAPAQLSITQPDQRRPFDTTPPFVLPTLPGLKQLDITNVILDARSALLPDLEAMEIQDATMIVLIDSKVFQSIAKLRIKMYDEDPPSTTHGRGSVFLTEPRGLNLFSNINTLVLIMKEDHHFGNLIRSGVFGELLDQTERFFIRTSEEPITTGNIDENEHFFLTDHRDGSDTDEESIRVDVDEGNDDGFIHE